MNREEHESLAEWVASVTKAMHSVDKFGQASLSTFDKMVEVLREHEARLEVLERTLQNLCDVLADFIAGVSHAVDLETGESNNGK